MNLCDSMLPEIHLLSGNDAARASEHSQRR